MTIQIETVTARVTTEEWDVMIVINFRTVEGAGSVAEKEAAAAMTMGYYLTKTVGEVTDVIDTMTVRKTGWPLTEGIIVTQGEMITGEGHEVDPMIADAAEMIIIGKVAVTMERVIAKTLPFRIEV